MCWRLASLNCSALILGVEKNHDVTAPVQAGWRAKKKKEAPSAKWLGAQAYLLGEAPGACGRWLGVILARGVVSTAAPVSIFTGAYR
jgi:hypothetical protein